MNALLVTILVSLAALASASVHHGGAVVAGPAGVVTSHGAIGPVGGHVAAAVVPGAVAVGHGAAIVAPSAHAVVSGPAWGGVWGGHGLLGLGGYGWGAGHGWGHGGAVVAGPHAAPAVIHGPSGSIAASGVWGPTAHWGGHWGGHGHW